MNAGELVHRVSIREIAEATDGHDGLVDTVTVLHRRIPAKVRPLVGRDLERARQIDPRISHEVSLRHWRAYGEDHDGGRVEIVYHEQPEVDRVFEIVAPPVDEHEAHIMLTVLCREAA